MQKPEQYKTYCQYIAIATLLVTGSAESQQYIKTSGSGTIPEGGQYNSIGTGTSQSAIYITGASVTGTGSETNPIRASAIDPSLSGKGGRAVYIGANGKLTLSNAEINSSVNATNEMIGFKPGTGGTGFLTLDNIIGTSTGQGTIGILSDGAKHGGGGLTVTNSTILTTGAAGSVGSSALKLQNGGDVSIINSTFNAENSGDAVFVQNPTGSSTIELTDSTFRTGASRATVFFITISGSGFAETILSGTNTFTGLGSLIEILGNARFTSTAGSTTRIDASGDNRFGLTVGTGADATLSGVVLTHTGVGGRGMNVSGSGSTLSVATSNIEMSGQDARGIIATNAGNASLTGTTINTSGTGAVGLSAEATGIISGNTVTLTASGANAIGAQALGSGSSLGLQTSQMTMQGDNAMGLIARTGANASATDTTITTTGVNAIGVAAQDAGTVDLTGTTLNTNGRDNTSLLADGAGSKITGNTLSINLGAENGVGVAAQNAGDVSLQGAVITTTGLNTVALSAETTGVISGNTVTLTASGANAIGAQALGSGSTLGLQTSQMTMQGDNAMGLIARTGANASATDTTITTTGANSIGVAAQDAGRVTLTGTTLNTNGQGGIGLVAQGAGSEINLSNVSVNANAAGSVGIVARQGGLVSGLDAGTIITVTGTTATGVRAESASTLNLTGTTINTSGTGALALSAEAGGVISGNTVTLNATGANAIGAQALGSGSSLGLQTSQITMSGDNAIGLIARTGANASATDTTITTTSANSIGVGAQDAGIVNLTGTTLNTDGADNISLLADGAGSKITGNTLSINLGAENGVGVAAQNAGDVSLQGGAITTTGLNAVALSAESGGKISANTVNISIGSGGALGGKSTGTGSTLNLTGGQISVAENAIGLLATSSGVISATENTTLNTTGANSIGVAAQDAGIVTLTGTTLNTNGADNTSLLADGAGSKITGNTLSINLGAENGVGVAAQNAGDVSLQGGAITTTGLNAVALSAESGGKISANTVNINIGSGGVLGGKSTGTGSTLNLTGGQISVAENAISLLATSSGVISATENTTLNTTGANSIGVAAQDAGVVTLTGTTLNTNGADNISLLADGAGSKITGNTVSINLGAENGVGVAAQNAGDVRLQGGAITTTGLNAVALSAESGGKISANTVNINIGSGGVLGGKSTGTGSTLNLTGGQISVAENAIGLLATSSGVISATQNTTLNTTGVNSIGVAAQDAGIVTLTGTTLNTNGADNISLLADGAGSKITGNTVSINLGAENGVGVAAQNAGDVSLQGGAITTTGLNAVALSAESGGKISANNIAVTVGQGGIAGLSAQGTGSLARLQASNILVSGDNTTALYAAEGAELLMTNGSTLVTRGVNATGGVVETGGTLTLNATQLRTEGANSTGLVVRAQSLSTLQNASVNTLGDQSTGLKVLGQNAAMTVINSQVRTSGAEAHAIHLGDGGTLFIDPSTIIASGTNSVGLLVQGNTPGSINQLSLIHSEITSTQSVGILLDGQGLNVSMSGQSRIQGGNVGIALQAMNGGVLTLSATDQSVIHGSATVDTSSQMTLDLQGTATFNGASNGVQHIHLGSSARWNMTGTSTVGTLDQSGFINFLPPDSLGFKTLTATTLSGGGAFRLNIDLMQGVGDLLLAANDTGTHGLLLSNPGTGGARYLQVVETGTGQANFNLLNRGRAVDVGEYQYDLVRGSHPLIAKEENDWYILKTDKASNSALDSAAAGSVGVAETLWYSNVSSLLKRLGDLRLGQDQGGAWIRGYGNKIKVNALSSTNPMTQDIFGLSFGGDTLLYRGDDVHWYWGAMGGYTNSTRRLSSGGDANVDAWSLATYATMIHEQGYYLDLVLNYTYFQNEYKPLLSDGSTLEGRFNTGGVGFDIELGRRFLFNEGWFIEPQFELSNMWLGKSSFNLSNGLSVHNEGGSLTQARLGGLFGKTISLGNQKEIQPYMRLSMIGVKDSGRTIRVGSLGLSPDVGGYRTEIGIGIIGKIKNHGRFYADLDYVDGEKHVQPWGINFGYRYLW